ncbi:hypothetical protein COOONC_15656 [Cooperia oncophora]
MHEPDRWFKVRSHLVSFDLYFQNGHIHYRVFFAENVEEETMSLSDASKLVGLSYLLYVVDLFHSVLKLPKTSALQAAFFNSKFFPTEKNKKFLTHQIVLAFHVVILERIVSNSKQHICYLVFVIRIEKGRQKHHLSENELYLVAEKLGAVHAINTASMAPEFLRVIEENHENIRRYQVSIEPQLLGILKEALRGELSHYFSLPMEVIPRLEAILKHNDDFTEPSERVICHGHLTAENCHFKDISQYSSGVGPHENEVVDISDWENVHFGDVALDLSNLIISSAEPSVRRNKYMSIFRRYYYSRVDYRPTNFRLADLKRLFRKHHKHAVDYYLSVYH